MVALRIEEAAEAAAKKAEDIDNRADEANGREVTPNRARIAALGIREELAAASVAHLYIYRTLTFIKWTLVAIAIELAVLIAR